MKKLIVLIIAIFTISIANAQWVQTSLNGGLNSFIFSMAVNGDTIFAGSNGGVHLSIDNGDNWVEMNNGWPGATVTALAIKGNYVYAGMGSGLGVYLSTNNGNSWTALNTGMSTELTTGVGAILITDTTIFAGCTNYGVYLSTNNGNSWTAHLDVELDVRALARRDSNIFAAGWGGIYLSTNNGNSWTEIDSTLADWEIFSLAISGNNIFVGTYDGVYLSSDNGSNWHAVNNGIPATYSVNGIVISGNKVFAGNYGGGVYLSTNNGNSWTTVNDGFNSDAHYIISLAINENYIFAGTYNGVWKRPLSDFAFGIDENTLNNVSVYPNPTKDNLTIETNSTKEQRLEIINLIGQTVYTNIINKKAVVNTSAFANGVYILKLSSDKETKIIKFIKQ